MQQMNTITISNRHVPETLQKAIWRGSFGSHQYCKQIELVSLIFITILFWLYLCCWRISGHQHSNHTGQIIRPEGTFFLIVVQHDARVVRCVDVEVIEMAWLGHVKVHSKNLFVGRVALKIFLSWKSSKSHTTKLTHIWQRKNRLS